MQIVIRQTVKKRPRQRVRNALFAPWQYVYPLNGKTVLKRLTARLTTLQQRYMALLVLFHTLMLFLLYGFSFAFSSVTDDDS